MAKTKSVYICQKCGSEQSKWAGQCPQCGEWNSLVETVVSTKKGTLGADSRALTGVRPLKLSEVGVGQVVGQRLPTGFEEFDRVLGGGMVPGSVVLLAGEPGIGKSTLLTQLALRVATSTSPIARSKEQPRATRSASHSTLRDEPSGLRLRSSDSRSSDSKSSGQARYPFDGLRAGEPRAVLYVCGEESPEQIKLRVERVTNHAPQATRHELNLLLLSETDTDSVVAEIQAQGSSLGLVIVDSIQTMSTEDLTGMAGSIGQIRESAFRLIEVAKRERVPLFLVGHVTKEGVIAGPKVVEHMVDVVLELSGERQHDFRILRGLKNRFGATDEVGVFAMRDRGMEEVKNPSDVFLEERPKITPGSMVVVTMAGIRPLCTEIQALVVPTTLAVPRRVSQGIDQRKVQLMAAVLTKHCRLGLSSSDIFVSVTGGLQLNEPGTDLGVALAIASGFTNKPLPKQSVAIGEVGLLGEIRAVGRMKQRVQEAKKLGFKTIISGETYSSITDAVRKLLR